MSRMSTAVTGGRERTWFELRTEWEQRMRREVFDEQTRQALPKARNKEPQPQPWDSVDLGERCDWTDLHKVSCAHCIDIDLYYSTDYPSAEVAA